MDKREEKSRAAILSAFSRLLMSKNYSKINVQDILDEAKVSRSTFYAHFQNKNDLLHSVSEDLFSHVLSAKLHKEAEHDFSHSSAMDYRSVLEHIAWHFYEEKELMKAIFSSEVESVFSDDLRKMLLPSFSAWVAQKAFFKQGVPTKMQSCLFVEGYIAMLKHWTLMGCISSPSEIVSFFEKLYC